LQCDSDCVQLSAAPMVRILQHGELDFQPDALLLSGENPHVFSASIAPTSAWAPCSLSCPFVAMHCHIRQHKIAVHTLGVLYGNRD